MTMGRDKENQTTLIRITQIAGPLGKKVLSIVSKILEI